MDYLQKGSPLFLDDFHKIADKQAQFEKESAELLTDDLQREISVKFALFCIYLFGVKKIQTCHLLFKFSKGLGNVKFDALYQFTQHPMQEFFHQIPLLKDELTRYAKSNNTVVIQASSDVSLQTLQKTLQEYDIHLPVHAADKLVEGQQQVTIGQLASGFHLMDEKLVFITEKRFSIRK